MLKMGNRIEEECTASAVRVKNEHDIYVHRRGFTPPPLHTPSRDNS
jgi:hypothetical protein